MRGRHEIDAALAHRFHQRHTLPLGTEAAVDAGGFERRYDEIGVVHDFALLSVFLAQILPAALPWERGISPGGFTCTVQVTPSAD